MDKKKKYLFASSGGTFGEKFNEKDAENLTERFRHEVEMRIRKRGFGFTPRNKTKNIIISGKVPATRRKPTFDQTRKWESVDLVQRVVTKLKKGQTYNEICDYYNSIRKSLGLPETVKPANLRKLVSKARNKKDIHLKTFYHEKF